MSDTPADIPKGELTLRTLAMPRDVNTNGDIFGGWVLS
jgi:acyl-CoA thioesterase YciA